MLSAWPHPDETMAVQDESLFATVWSQMHSDGNTTMTCTVFSCDLVPPTGATTARSGLLSYDHFCPPALTLSLVLSTKHLKSLLW